VTISRNAASSPCWAYPRYNCASDFSCISSIKQPPLAKSDKVFSSGLDLRALGKDLKDAQAAVYTVDFWPIGDKLKETQSEHGLRQAGGPSLREAAHDSREAP